MSPLKLSAVIALEKGATSQGSTVLTQAYHNAQRTGLFSGLSRVYKPKDEDGDQLPPESTQVQATAHGLLNEVAKSVGRMFDVAATRDEGNTAARGNVEVDGEVILENVPVTTLLYLEKKLGELFTLVAKLPTLDPAEVWDWDEHAETWRSAPASTVRTKRVPRNHVKAEATEKHPAQVEVYNEDIPVGTWTATKFSGALSRQQASALKERLRKLSDAVKVARETANSVVVEDVHVSQKIFGYLLAP